MRIYTRTGDRGETGLPGGLRLWKDSPRIEACGAVDELNCLLGLARAEQLPGPIDEILARVQRELFGIGAQLASPAAGEGKHTPGPELVQQLEADIDRFPQGCEPLTRFVLPGGTRAAAVLHLARAVCRRCERRVVRLSGQADEPVPADLLAYLNRLADLLFVLARAANAAASQPEEFWDRE